MGARRRAPLQRVLLTLLAAALALSGCRPARVRLYESLPPEWGRKASPEQLSTAKQLGVPVAKEVSFGEGVCLKLILIPGGEFAMGSGEGEAGRQPTEGPWHAARIAEPFYLSVTEVTQDQYEAVMGALPARFFGGSSPIEQVSWEDATEFCRKLSEKTGLTVRLPTEAEWEYACRAGSKTAFCQGDDAGRLGDCAWYEGNSGGTTHEVGQKKPNAWGLYDMHGNVAEWCRDLWGQDYYAKGPRQDPGGPERGEGHVVRGGSWQSPAVACGSARRVGASAKFSDAGTGFRVVVELGSPDAEWGRAPEWVKKTVSKAQKAAAQELSLPVAKEVCFEGGVSMRLVLVPAGEFMMGTAENKDGRPEDEERYEHERPQHRVRITKPFYVGVTEVTNAQYEAVTGQVCGYGGTLEGPVAAAQWDDVVGFCQKLSERTGLKARLPTEAEWEYACRAGSTGAFCYGDDPALLGEYAWYWDNTKEVGEGYPHRVGLKKPNGWGLYDMHGNVEEWCQDWMADDYYERSPVDDPQGPEKGESGAGDMRVGRGGEWQDEPRLCRSAWRGVTGQGGFRVVVEVR